MTWPNLPPWWLIDAARLGDVLGRTSADVHRWARQGSGPAPAPYWVHNRKRPWWYWHEVQNWAAGQIGEAFPYESQCDHFFTSACPVLVQRLEGREEWFDKFFAEARQIMARGGRPTGMPPELVRELDPLWTAQPCRYGRYDSRTDSRKLTG